MFLRAESPAGALSATQGGSPGGFRLLRDMPLGWAATAVTASLGQAVVLALTPGATGPGVWALRTLLMLVPLLLVATAMVVLWPLRNRLRATGSHLSVRLVATGSLVFLGLCLALWLTSFESSVALRSRRGLVLLSLFGGAALVAALGLGLLAGRSRLLARVGPERVGAVATLVLALFSFVIGRHIDLAPFWPLRFANVALEAALALAAAALLRRTQIVGARAFFAGLAAIGAAAVMAASLPAPAAHRAYARILLDGGSERRVLIKLRQVLDFGGDGFSAWLDGGDCEEGNPRARPLGEIDCDHILERSGPPSPPPALASVPQVSKVLVLTIDAWRCQLRGRELCPSLDRLVEAGSYRGWQRPYMAQTLRSLGALFGAPYEADLAATVAHPSHVVGQARAAGYATKAFHTLPGLNVPSVAGAFAEVDTSLTELATDDSVVSGRMAERVLADLRARQAAGGRSLLWAHFMDPHAMYVPTDEGQPVPLLVFDRRGSYVAEVRRVEQTVANLVEAARRAGYDRDAAIVITGDHGESFSHGRIYHSLSSYDDELKVPLYAWVYDAGGHLVRPELPARTDERSVATLLAKLVGAPPPPRQSALTITDPLDGDVQYVVVEDGWKIIYHLQGHFDELYHLDVDPDELHNLADERPADLQRLRRRLGAELRPLLGERVAGSGGLLPALTSSPDTAHDD